MPYLINALLAINVIVCLLIILLVLMQRPRNEGLGAAFGGGVTEGLFGTHTTHVLAKITRWLGGIFFALTLGLGFLYSRNFGAQKSALERRLSEAPIPVPAATPAAATPAPGAVPVLPDGGTVPAPEAPAPGTPAPPVPSGGVVPSAETPAPATPPAGVVSPAPAPNAPSNPTPGTPEAPAPTTPAAPAPTPAAPK